MSEGTDHFMQESSKSYKQVRIKNSAELTALKRHSNELDAERKISTANMDREQKMLMVQLRRMKMEQELFAMAKQPQVLEDPRAEAPATSPEPEEPFVNPYPLSVLSPVSFAKPGSHRTTEDFEELGRQYARRRGRRMSKEFEDLHLHAATGSLTLPPLKRVPQRNLLQPVVRKSISNSAQNLSTVKELEHWVGNPHAINSVRRPKKSSEQLQKDFVLQRSVTDLAENTGHTSPKKAHMRLSGPDSPSLLRRMDTPVGIQSRPQSRAGRTTASAHSSRPSSAASHAGESSKSPRHQSTHGKSSQSKSSTKTKTSPRESVDHADKMFSSPMVKKRQRKLSGSSSFDEGSTSESPRRHNRSRQMSSKSSSLEDEDGRHDSNSGSEIHHSHHSPRKSDTISVNDTSALSSKPPPHRKLSTESNHEEHSPKHNSSHRNSLNSCKSNEHSPNSPRKLTPLPSHLSPRDFTNGHTTVYSTLSEDAYPDDTSPSIARQLTPIPGSVTAANKGEGYSFVPWLPPKMQPICQ